MMIPVILDLPKDCVLGQLEGQRGCFHGLD